MRFIKHSNTSNLIRFTLKHSTTGAGLTGLAFGTSGLIISTICNNEATPTVYNVVGTTIETITTLGTFETPTATKCRFKEVDATNHPGLYEFQIANARFAVASARTLVITVSGAANLLTADYEILLTTWDPHVAIAQTGDNFARIGATGSGLTSLAQASVCTEGRLSELDAANLPADLTDVKGATFVSSTDSLEAIRDRGDAAWTTGAGGSDRLLMVDTTIATLASQTSFTLTAGSADDDAYNNCTIVIEDVSTATQKAVGLISDYTGASKTVTLKY
ncbi:MAG: hypothetical protein KKB45_03355, partial [Gammaproteobacteria bacterium]|nr:hypothetical protein [Gammaproteobacteria bacterium]